MVREFPPPGRSEAGARGDENARFSRAEGGREVGPAEMYIDSRELELAQGTFNEVAIYEAIARVAAVNGQRTGRPLHLLDVCAATGLAAHHASANIRVGSMTLVDIDPEVLRLAGPRHDARWPEFHLVCADAVEFTGERGYDLIVANSAYHHIEDERKGAFLRRLCGLLSHGGQLLIGDHFLPPYEPGDAELRGALRKFYGPLLVELRRRGTREEAVAVVTKAFELALRRQVEFKVSWKRFEDDVRQGGLIIEDIIHIWDPGLADCGSRIVQLRSATS